MDAVVDTLHREYPEREWSSTPFGETLPLHQRQPPFSTNVCCKGGWVIAVSAFFNSSVEWQGATGRCGSCGEPWLMVSALEDDVSWYALLEQRVEPEEGEGRGVLLRAKPVEVIYINANGDEHRGASLPTRQQLMAPR